MSVSHEVYGYSLNIIDLNTEFTLGELAKRRQEIVNQLIEDGVFTLNKEIPLPRLTKRIAVISSESAAGYGDFCHQIEQSPYAFPTFALSCPNAGRKRAANRHQCLGQHRARAR